MKKLKIAVSISSRLRNNNDVSLKSIVTYFSNFTNVEVDYFVHLNRKSCCIIDGKRSFSQNKITDDDEQMIVKLLNPKKLVIEEGYQSLISKINKTKISKNDWLIDESLNNDYHRLYQYHSFEESIKLIHEYEYQTQTEYDLIFKMRPDIFVRFPQKTGEYEILNFVNSYRNHYGKFSSPWATAIDADKLIVALHVECMNGVPRICDVVYYGSSKSMKLFSYNIIENLIEYYLQLNDMRLVNKPLADNLFTPESFFTYPITKNRMNIQSLEFINFIPIRGNYNGTTNFEELNNLFIADTNIEMNRITT